VITNYPASGFCAHPELIRATAMFMKAAAIANGELKLIDARRARAIARAADEVIARKWNDQFVVNDYQAAAGVSFHMNANEVIANRAIELLGGKLGECRICDPNDHVYCSQSTMTYSQPPCDCQVIFIWPGTFCTEGARAIFFPEGAVVRPCS
jgi:aspartate ammonia-lyase